MATIGDDCDEAQSDRKKSKSCKQALKEIYDLKIDSDLGKFNRQNRYALIKKLISKIKF